ncbi:sporulation membrane protein YtrI [Neobacillus sp. SM06]|uniref:sporulation membrane protein YtrI n=1 Tax=Neobacillus sp. SM06 TaxID=3422492 RepID=UPI003D2DE967
MRIPPLYRKRSWQRFFAGAAIGGVISWLIFLYMFGVWQEKHTKLIREQQEHITDLNDEIKIWQDEYKAANKRNIEQLTVQKINVKITNGEKYDLDSYSVYVEEDSVKEDLQMMVAKDLDTVYKSKDLLKKIIENKPVRINGKRYKLVIKEIVIYTTISIQLELQYEK